MKQVALLVPNLTAADAVSNDVLGMARRLRNRGCTVGVFAAQGEVPGVPTQRIEQLQRWLTDPNGLALYHCSTSWVQGSAALARLPGRKVVKYHNVTPAEFFEGYHQDFVNACTAGRRELEQMARAGYDGYLADSEFNLQELLAAGSAPARAAVVPPFHLVDRLLELPPAETVLRTRTPGQTTLLMVGRLVPNKGHAALLEAFAFYRRQYNPRSRLILVGKADERLAAYPRALRSYAAELGVGSALELVGGVSDAELKAYYQIADVFLLTSRHEGFCVPLVEAMALRVPIVALGTTAVPTTVAAAGLVWPEADAALLAASIDRVVRDGTVRDQLTQRGWQRYREHFSNEQIERQFLRWFGKLEFRL